MIVCLVSGVALIIFLGCNTSCCHRSQSDHSITPPPPSPTEEQHELLNVVAYSHYDREMSADGCHLRPSLSAPCLLTSTEWSGEHERRSENDSLGACHLYDSISGGGRGERLELVQLHCGGRNIHTQTSLSQCDVHTQTNKLYTVTKFINRVNDIQFV